MLFLQQKFFIRNFYQSKDVEFIIIIFYIFCVSFELELLKMNIILC